MKQLATTLTAVIVLISVSFTTMAQLKTSIPDEVHLLQNPFRPMNILIIPANIEGITALQGDLVMAFDGETCVGAALIEDVNAVLNLVATSTDKVNKGYKAGQTIRLEYHSVYNTTMYELTPIKIILGSMNFEELGTFYANFTANALSVEENTNKSEFKVYPNPVSQKLHIILELDNTVSSKNIKLQLVNISGAVITEKEYPLNQSVINIDVAELPTGEYTLLLYHAKLRFTQKVIKK